ncbi:MAG: hypothetical protein KZQ64_07625 [gamma proteobacterium symbiont of Bathyaustriella thionipta]|nr:hypothetical protein [gamma proteobacterium symbiont of Bathyaustriella thionipta]MCU7950510.1 hypothetical protein [gamma proteobacterium symbiont of Bathyaustriella thionipta]MCU7953241.1 hypothetical protein [gamma proteobacterium symbiont of Bathyaustriella thionipta]MCU7957004.1 hypothetical protein [gamma proteobacterium symbiont of Bathyaustriella thionipta]MCU7965936.1 hypothetical protein [gamma proteobacterium symbiont of Bathyaustriella thionipta]
MNKVRLIPRNINTLKRDPEGPKVQRIWIPELDGLGVDLGKSKRSFIYKFKSPVTNKFRIITLDNYSYSQELNKSQLNDIEDDYYQLRRKIRNGVDPLAEKDIEREQRKQ